ncbi:tail tip assembly protein [Salmonella virus STSR3]|nr:tail tip assembly protein [Salmonella virus STSR3]
MHSENVKYTPEELLEAQSTGVLPPKDIAFRGKVFGARPFGISGSALLVTVKQKTKADIIESGQNQRNPILWSSEGHNLGYGYKLDGFRKRRRWRLQKAYLLCASKPGKNDRRVRAYKPLRYGWNYASGASHSERLLLGAKELVSKREGLRLWQSYVR